MKLPSKQHPPAQGAEQRNSGAGPGGRTVFRGKGARAFAKPWEKLLQYLDDGIPEISRILPTRAKSSPHLPAHRERGHQRRGHRSRRPTCPVSCWREDHHRAQNWRAQASLQRWLRERETSSESPRSTRAASVSRVRDRGAPQGLPGLSLLTGATTSRICRSRLRNGRPRRHGI